MPLTPDEAGLRRDVEAGTKAARNAYARAHPRKRGQKTGSRPCARCGVVPHEGYAALTCESCWRAWRASGEDRDPAGLDALPAAGATTGHDEHEDEDAATTVAPAQLELTL